MRSYLVSSRIRPLPLPPTGLRPGSSWRRAGVIAAVLTALVGCSDAAENNGAGAVDSGAWRLFDAGGVDASDTTAGQTADVAASADAQVELEAGITSDGGSSADASVADASTADAGPTTCPGAPGCSCAAAPDCNDGLCIETPLGRRCAAPCGAACEAGFACKKLTNGAGKTVDACVPGWGRLCQPCGASKDCEAAGLTDALCVDQGASGLFCGAACVENDDCPAGYGCQVVNSTEGKKAKQCVRLPPSGSAEAFGECACWPASKADGLSTKCFANQTTLDGSVVGKCPGQRICGQTGLGDCILIAAKAEVCDGIDNDCNGAVDENAAGCGVDEACVQGKCSKVCTAVNGGWSGWVWGACSVACGGGTRTGTHSCTAPPPSCGGQVCPGAATKSEPCNAQACSAGTLAKGVTVYSEGGKKVGGTVPAGVTSATVQLWGAGGAGCYPGNGGGGAYVSVKIAVQTGDSLDFRVASAGESLGGGGGASFVSKNGVQIAVAGGGGAGCDGCSGCSGAATIGAGGGGGKAGGAGQNGTANNKYNTNSAGGVGGSAAAGGAGGKQTNTSSYTGCEADGIAGGKDTGGGCAGGFNCKVGPSASVQTGSASCIGNGSGGGGGAGYYGGGSGAAKYTYSGGGGGGGSSWIGAGAQLLSSESGALNVPGGLSAPGYALDAARGGDGVQKAFSGKPTSGKHGLIVLTL